MDAYAEKKHNSMATVAETKSPETKGENKKPENLNDLKQPNGEFRDEGAKEHGVKPSTNDAHAHKAGLG